LRDSKLKVGKIPYANLFPIFHYLDTECDHSGYRFIEGVPSRLNRMLRNGELDISPSSSVEFLRYKKKYVILPWFSVSSTGPIKSILLFSKLPIEKLQGETIAVTSESETSTTLLKIILKKFLSLKCKFRPTRQRSVKKILSTCTAVLHIGDTAMKEAKKISKISDSKVYIYDLGELWDKYTGLPFVYALWIVRKKSVSQKGDQIRKFSEDLMKAVKYANKKWDLIVREAPQSKWLGEKELVDYWKIISYDFTEKHLKGLRLFEKYTKSL
jgi:chorismate dehydratase